MSLKSSNQLYQAVMPLKNLAHSLSMGKRLVKTKIPGPISLALTARRNAACSSGLGTSLPVFMQSASGVIVTDVDGNQFIDMGAGIGVMNVGHCHPNVVERVQNQAETLTHTCFTATPYLGYVEVCEGLNRLTPGSFAKKSVLFNSGAEAVENAVKIARLHTKRQGVVVFEHCYHGRTNLTMAMTAKNIPYKQGFGPFAPEVHRMPMAYPLRWPGGSAKCGEQALAIIKSKIEKEVGPENVACVVIEPVQGEGGFIVPPPGFLAGLQDMCAKHGIIFVADEVQSGFGRTGKLFACEHDNLAPDLIITAKGIAGGLPLSAVTGRAEIMDSIHAGGLGGTYSGSPASCAAALGVFEAFEKEDLVENARLLGEVMSDRLGEMQKQFPGLVAEVRGRGAMMAVELVKPGSATPLEPNYADVPKIVQYCAEQGVLVLTAGTYGNVIRFLPPLCMSTDTLHEAMDVFEDALASVVKK